ncbi:MAG: FAD-binding protein [Nocardioides sp.]
MTATNWAQNLTYRAAHRHRPASVAELQSLVASSRRLKALGTRHCFNDIADVDGAQVELSGLPPVLEIDSARASARVSAASRYGDIAASLDAAGFAVPNLASLPHISVAGAVATATHGSGEQHGCLSTSVSALELVTADGEVRSYSRADDPEVFPGLVVGLGALGVLTSVTLDLVPRFDARQDLYERLDWDAALEHFDEIQRSGYSVSLFTSWSAPYVEQVWLKNVATPGFEAPADLFGAPAAMEPLSPVAWSGGTAENCNEQLGRPGPWYDRLPHFRLDFTPSVGLELQTEYFVPRASAAAAIAAVRGLGERITPLLIVAEIRTVAADDLWMSPFHGTDSVGLHFTWQPRQPEVEAVLPDIEAALAPYDAKPHWGKVFHHPAPDALHARMDDFRSLVAELDPHGTFRNDYLDRVLGSS